MSEPRRFYIYRHPLNGGMWFCWHPDASEPDPSLNRRGFPGMSDDAIADELRNRGHEVIEALEVVERDHDERAEHVHDFRGDPPRCTFPGCTEKPWQPDPRTVKAVVEALRERALRNEQFGLAGKLSYEEVIDFVVETFNLTEGRDDDG